MPYEGIVRSLLQDAGAAEGDEVRVEPADGPAVQGIVMPHHAFSDPDVITLKLTNGYNVGVALTEDADLTLESPATEPPEGEREIPERSDLPTVAILGTGGTIASFVDYRTGAVHPATSPEELAFADPELFDVANLRARVIFQEFSENLTPDHWTTLAQEAAKALESGARGVVIPHGTDTMGYTAAALSFMLDDLPGPVVLVGAQRSSDRPSTDAALNLRAAVRIAATADLGEVVVTMHGETGDTVTHVHRGTRVRKMHTSRRDAFQSVNAPPIGTATGEGVDLTEDHQPTGDGPAQADTRLEPNVHLAYVTPGMDPGHLPDPEDVAGLVLAGTGLGHIPHNVHDRLRDHVTAGNPVVVASQCLHGRTNLHVYSTGRDLLDLGVIPAGDMLPETALVKTMIALGRTQDLTEVRNLLTTDLRGELAQRTLPTTYPQPPQEVEQG